MVLPAEITVSTQTFDEEVSSLCSSGVPPIILTGVFIQLLRQKFVDPDEIEHPTLKGNTWTPEAETSKILIQPAYQWNPQEIQKRPALLIRRQEINTRILGLNNQFQGGFNDPDGATRHETIHGSGHLIFCVGRTGGEAEILGTEVWKHFLHFGPILREDLKLARLQVMQLSEVGKVEESAEHWSTVVSVATFYYETWQLILEAPILKNLALNAVGATT